MTNLTISSAMRMMAEMQEALNGRQYLEATHIQAELFRKVLCSTTSRDLQQLADIALMTDDMAPIRN